MPTRRFRTSRLARFGDFELDARSGELRRAGVSVRLQEQPFRILTMLLEHPGDVVLREDIRKRLWPNDTVVEVGHGINAAVLRLREALGESAEEPHFIQTLPKRGYRFNGQVEWETGPLVTVVGGTVGVTVGSTRVPRTAVAEADITGQTVSHYRVLDRLGSGGMGVVYRAEDLQLGRHVALKFLSREFAQDPAARAWFQREARAASALNHPNVCTVYSVEECAGQPMISMELVEGETLSAMLARGPLPAAQALALAIQVAAALEAAHRKGVVHRDLKPGNLMVTSCGVKVLDFGIAQMDRTLDRKLDRPAVGEAHTFSGTVVGTPHYMSPEQQQGKETDARSDVYSFGLVLYEMLTGRQASGDGPRVLAAELPPGILGLLSRCLASDPPSRWQTAGELKAELERTLAQAQAPPLPVPVVAAAPVAAVVPPVPARPTVRGLIAGWRTLAAAAVAPPPVAARPPASGWVPGWRTFAAAATALLLLIGGLALRPGGPLALKASRFMLTGPIEAAGTHLKLSPDSRSLVFSSGSRHYVRSFDPAEVRQLYAADGPGTAFWSPDSRSVAIAGMGQMVRIGVAPGSLATRQAGVNTNMEGAWGPDGTILIGRIGDGLYRIPAGGGTPVQVTALDPGRGETRHLLPQFLPDGRRFLYVAGSATPGASALWAGSLDSARRTEVMPIQSNFAFVPDKPGAAKGRLVYLRDRMLVAQPFDSARLATFGEPFAVGPPVASTGTIGSAVSIGDFSATPKVLTYRTGNVVTVVRNWLAEAPPIEGSSAKFSSLLMPPVPWL